MLTHSDSVSDKHEHTVMLSAMMVQLLHYMSHYSGKSLQCAHTYTHTHTGTKPVCGPRHRGHTLQLRCCHNPHLYATTSSQVLVAVYTHTEHWSMTTHALNNCGNSRPATTLSAYLSTSLSPSVWTQWLPPTAETSGTGKTIQENGVSLLRES